MTIVTPALSRIASRAARGLVGWSQDELASKAGVALNTLRSFEAATSVPIADSPNAIHAALEAAGVEFMPKYGRAGLRMRTVEG